MRSSEVAARPSRGPAPFDGETLGEGRDLGEAAGARALGTTRHRIPPGCRAYVTHARLRGESSVYVLSGQPTLRWIDTDGAHETELVAGDFVSFPAATGIAHTVWNRTDADAELLSVVARQTSEKMFHPEDPAYAIWCAARRPYGAWTDARIPEGEGRWPATRIETPRLTLRAWEPSDTHALLAAQDHNRDHLLPWMIWARELPTADEMLDRISAWQRLCREGRDVVYGVFGPDGTVIGGTGLHDRVGEGAREIGYWVDRGHQGRGLVGEWVAGLVRVAFEVLELDRVEIRCDPENLRSAAVARRLGFRHEVTLPRRTIGIDGLPRDTMVWTMFSEDFERSALARTEVRAWDVVGRRLL